MSRIVAELDASYERHVVQREGKKQEWVAISLRAKVLQETASLGVNRT